jgi:hypothetical protein
MGVSAPRISAGICDVHWELDIADCLRIGTHALNVGGSRVPQLARCKALVITLYLKSGLFKESKVTLRLLSHRVAKGNF